MEIGPQNGPVMLRARLLGRSEISVGDRLLSGQSWPGRKARTLLLLLLSTPGHQFQRDELLELIWPDLDPDAATNALYKALHAVRRVLEPDLRSGRNSRYVETRGELIGLVPGIALRIDLEHFGHLLHRAETAPQHEQRQLLRSALDLYRGEFVADERYADWPIPQREALRSHHERATLTLAALDLDAGEPLATIPWLEALLAQDQTAEVAHRALMRAYMASGQRSLALRQYELCRNLLARDYDDEPEPETAQLAESIRQTPDSTEEDTVIRATAAKYRSLPAVPTRTVGRDEEITAVTTMLRDSSTRLVTITGTGGIGKTRLASEVATALRSDFPDGAGFVALAPVRDPELVFTTIASSLRIPEPPRRSPEQVVTDHLQPLTYLLVLDNLEQLPTAGHLIARLLEACPGLTVLATSRSPVRIRAEQLYRLDVLDLPPDRVMSMAHLEQIDSTALFLQHLRAQHVGNTAIGADPAVISELCLRLDGLPLAIELAAARCYEHTPAEILAQLNQRARIHILHDGPQDLPERHQTLIELVRWSYDLLPPSEQDLFRCLAVFIGGVELDALEAIGGKDAIALANSLEIRSLVHWTHVDGTRRLDMLETIREVAALLLESHGEAARLHLAHATFYAELVEHAVASKPRGADQLRWQARLERDLANIRAALDWSTNASLPAPHLGLRIMAGTGNYWFGSQHLREGMQWLERALVQVPAAHEPVRGWATFWATQFAERLGQDAASRAYKVECQEIFLALNDEVNIVRSQLLEMYHLQNESRWEETVALCTDQLARSRALEQYDLVVSSLLGIANSQIRLGASDSALGHLQEALAIVRMNGDLFGESKLLGALIGVALSQGEPDLAEHYADQSEAAARLVGAWEDSAWAIYSRVDIAFGRQRYAEALRLTRLAAPVFAEIGDPRMVAATKQTAAAILVAMGRGPEAAADFLEAMPGVIEFGSAEDHTSLLLEIGLLAVELNNANDALTLLAANSHLRSQNAEQLYPLEQDRFDAGVTQAHAMLSLANANEAWSHGNGISFEAAFDLARTICEEAALPANQVRAVG